jgi:hypothetical protein
VFGGSDARFNLESIKGFWSQAERKAEAAFCVSNGSFFYMPETPTRLPFSLKVDGVILTDGYGEDQYPEQKLMLELWADKADIRPLTGTDLYQSSAPNIIAGLTAEANKRAKFAVGRTFVGIQDRDSDGAYEVLYILSTQTHTQSGAAQVLQEFGAQKVMMLDGGGSAQLLCQGNEYIATGRLIPQAIAVFSADPHGLAATLVDAPVKISSGPQEIVHQEWTLENTGELTWTPGEYRLILEAGPYWEEQHFSPTQVVLPGQKLQFAWELPPIGQTGTFPLALRWYISGAGRRSEVQEHQQELVVFSDNTTAQSPGFTSEFERESTNSLRSLTTSGEVFELSSVEERVSANGEKISLEGLLIVPAIILPLGFLIFWLFSWWRSFSI